MSVNILELLKNEFSDEIIGKLGKFVGEDATKTKSALGSIFPAILGGGVGGGVLMAIIGFIKSAFAKK